VALLLVPRAPARGSYRHLRQWLTLLIFNIHYRVDEILLSPELLSTAAICPGRLFAGPASAFPHRAGGVGLEHSQHSERPALRGHHRMDVISSDIRRP